MAVNSVITAGVIISGASVSNSVLPRMSASTPTPTSSQHHFSHVNIGRHCRIRRAIIDRDVHIPKAPSSATTRLKTSAATSSRRLA